MRVNFKPHLPRLQLDYLDLNNRKIMTVKHALWYRPVNLLVLATLPVGIENSRVFFRFCGNGVLSTPISITAQKSLGLHAGRAGRLVDNDYFIEHTLENNSVKWNFCRIPVTLLPYEVYSTTYRISHTDMELYMWGRDIYNEI